ncbi:MAG: TlpA disulfide reductase family protein [Candidatus Atribacteria bacterium]|nr:TlpA disulfide reductase family protein [Candidatus Atribacteria bacterium]
MKKRSALLLICAALLILSISGCSVRPPASMEKDFTLNDLNGNSFTLSQHLGQPILLCFFLSGCHFCANEVPNLNAVYNKYKDSQGLLVLGIGVGSGISEFVTSHGVIYPALIDQNQAVADLYNVGPVPHNVFINKKGSIVRTEAHELTESELEQYLQEIL